MMNKVVYIIANNRFFGATFLQTLYV